MHKPRLIVLAGCFVGTTAYADVQSNGVWLNGVQLNGVQLNGVQLNGVQLNGVQLNGVQLNGVQLNGVQLNGVQLNGTELRGSFIGSGTATRAFQCSHREDVVGVMLPTSCSPCAAVVAASMSSCATSTWSSTCVATARANCIATITTGSTITTAAGDSFTIKVRNNGGLTSGADNTDVWWNTLNWKIPHAPNQTGIAMGLTTPSACVQHVVQQNPSCGTTTWSTTCTNAVNTLCTTPIESAQRAVAYGDSLCGYDANNTERQAIFLEGVWNPQQGVQGGGAKTKGTAAAPTFSIGCRAVGAIAKCVDFGYKPWLGTQHDSRHQACVRMVRADYCGDGKSWTKNGTPINVWDHDLIQRDTQSWTFEAAWLATGAACVHSTRLESVQQGQTETIHTYADKATWCSVAAWNLSKSVSSYTDCNEFHDLVVSEASDISINGGILAPP